MSAHLATSCSPSQSRSVGPGSHYVRNSFLSHFDYLRNLSGDYHNQLACTEPLRLHYPVRFLILLFLVAVCLIPRFLLSLRIGSICPDGTLYIRLANALNEGNFRQAFEGMNLNLYPVILLVLHRLGLSWETGGAIWGELISSLVVLPLFGLFRRQFDDTVAVVACLLYAVHPIFIQWSPELIRDPTFWFLFTLSLYLMWRAIIEVHFGLSLAAGLAVTFSVLTRFEGLFLLIPLALWTFWRYRALNSGGDKAKLAAGSLLAVIAFPALIILVNFTLLRNYSEWVFSRLYPLMLFQYWWNGITTSTQIDAAGNVIPSYMNITFSRMVAIYVPTLVKGLSPLFALLMLGGLWRWRRLWLRRDNQALFYTALAIMAAAWIHAWCAKESCERYFLPIVLMSSPFAALGLLALSGKMLSFVERMKGKLILQYLAIFTPAAIVAIVGLHVAFSGHFEQRTAEVALASWVRQEFGPQAVIYGSEGITPVIAYYANVNSVTLSKIMDDETILKNIEQLNPDVILLMATRRKDFHETRRLINRIEKLKYAELARNSLPHGTEDVLIVISRGQVNPPISMEAGLNNTSRH